MVLDKTSYDVVDTSTCDLFSQKTISQIDHIRSDKSKKIVFTASSFDLLHPGHILMLKDAKSKGDILVVALHTDPTINRSAKNKPVQTLEERRIMIESCRYVDEIIEYVTETDLYKILSYLNPELRVLGSDWEGKAYTGYRLFIPVYFHQRDHDWSTSGLRKRVYDAEKLNKIDEC
jgi:glycerol-3-phosphate cytidylyltransferase